MAVRNTLRKVKAVKACPLFLDPETLPALVSVIWIIFFNMVHYEDIVCMLNKRRRAVGSKFDVCV